MDGDGSQLLIAVYYFNRIQLPSELQISTLLTLPFIAMFLFVLALAMGLHHPPFMVPPDFQWPPFESLAERR